VIKILPHLFYVEAPSIDFPVADQKAIFLAGGVTGCPDWQKQMTILLVGAAQKAFTPPMVFNPRRADFPIHDPNAARAQIRWEHDRLREAHAILFWFCAETLNPIVLYELGAWSMTDKPLFVGVHPDYQRRADVEIQTELVRPDVQIVYSLYDLSRQVEAWL
jgi:hypothetical protein